MRALFYSPKGTGHVNPTLRIGRALRGVGGLRRAVAIVERIAASPHP